MTHHPFGPQFLAQAGNGAWRDDPIGGSVALVARPSRATMAERLGYTPCRRCGGSDCE